MTAIDNLKVEFLKTITEKDLTSFYTYNNTDSIVEVVRGWEILPTRDTPTIAKVKGLNYLVMMSKERGVIVSYLAKENNGEFELLELTSEAYNRYENFMRENM